MTAALVVKTLLEKYNIEGTIRVYPGIAEELLGSRTYMARDGLFKDLDIMLSTHLSNAFRTVWGNRGLALVSTQYSFHGVSAHGAGSPWKGRSALDAVELMNIGWNYRREHLPVQQRSPTSSRTEATSPTLSRRKQPSGTSSVKETIAGSKISTTSEPRSPARPP